MGKKGWRSANCEGRSDGKRSEEVALLSWSSFMLCRPHHRRLASLALLWTSLRFSPHFVCSRGAQGARKHRSHQLLGLSPVMPHWILQQLLAGADHLLHSYRVFVDFECWNCPHIFCARNSRALVYIHLSKIREYMSRIGKRLKDDKDQAFGSISYLEEINRWVFGTQCIHKRGNFGALLIRRSHEMDNRNTCEFETIKWQCIRLKKAKNFHHCCKIERAR